VIVALNKPVKRAGVMAPRMRMEQGQSELMIIQQGMDADGEFQLAAEMLNQAMLDASEGLLCNLVDNDLQPVSKKTKHLFTHTSAAKCSAVQALDACRFFLDGRAEMVLAIIEHKMQRCPLHLDWFKREIRKIAAEGRSKKAIYRAGAAHMKIPQPRKQRRAA